ncbi:transcriptional regulator [Rhodococcus sp. H29-C3]|uniref:helix-turn-helix transcriptional regulator n=1 Tax=Rhodococcus sp. H29-C3 TaxID=3046307 RepID=UPI0024BA5BC5|nr:transcriptional regulator [Rhodococcus sp. H29-C3]MDJ0363132.1 transcriptional regulator [Rhodococcus sp. H29-C3]
MPEEELTLPQVLTRIEERMGKKIAASTWRSYVARDQAPKPVRRVGREPMFAGADIEEWIKERPGRGARTDLQH